MKWLDVERGTGLSMPTYQSELAAGMDIQAAVVEDILVALAIQEFRSKVKGCLNCLQVYIGCQGM